nr:hypothetical protein [Candidatus Sigynarchaeota archaeon]
MEQESTQINNGKKLALLLIGIGLILGGAVGIFQSPPAKAESGWTVRNTLYGDDGVVVVPDVDGDGVADVFYWINPQNYDMLRRVLPQQFGWIKMNDSLVEKWDQKYGAVLVSGRTGNIINEMIGSDTPWYVNLHIKDGFTLAPCLGTHVVVLAAPVKNYSALYLNANDSIDWNSAHLLRIALDNLEIDLRANLTANGWEYPEAFSNPSVSSRNYYPWVRYLKNWSIPAPGLTQSRELIVIKNNNLRWNGTGFVDMSNFSFVDPQTFTSIARVEWDKLPLTGYDGMNNFRYGFCTGPANDAELFWNYPYFFMTYANISMSNPTTPYYLAIAPIDQLNSNPLLISWTIVNYSVGNLKTWGNPGAIALEDQCIISLNSTGGLASFTLYQKFTAGIQNPILASDRPRVSEAFPAFNSPEIFVTVASRVTCIAHDGIEPAHTTFTQSVKIPSFNGSVFGINTSNSFGTVKAVIPVSIGHPPITSTIGLVFSDEDPVVKNFKDMKYPVIKMSMAYLHTNASGTTPVPLGTIYNSTNGTSQHTPQFEAAINVDLNMRVSTSFDLDADNVTDIPVPGTLFSPTNFAKVEARRINGPCFTFTYNNTLVQELFFTVWGSTYLFLGDLNGDFVGDYLISNIMIFLRATAVVPLTEIQQRLADPVTGTLFVSGIILAIVGVLILVGMSRMKSARLRMAIPTKKWPIALLVASLVLIAALYLLLFNITDTITKGSTTAVGDSPAGIAVANLIRISGIGTFTFLLALPVTAGLYVLFGPPAADGIVQMNQIFFTKTAGIKAAVKKRAISDKDTQRMAKLNYRIILIPPFGRKINYITVFGRIMSVLSLATAVGLYAFNFLANLDPNLSISGITDENFVAYISSLFTFLIIPGIAAIPLFFWFFPSTWLLDDAGVLFYIKRLNNRHPEDVEAVGGWFSTYLKGFLSISAFINYIEFVIASPVFASYSSFGSAGASIVIFVFGFIIVAGITFGMLAVAFNELILPYNAARLYKRLDKRHISIERKSIEFGTYERLTSDETINGFLDKKPTGGDNEEKRDPVVLA